MLIVGNGDFSQSINLMVSQTPWNISALIPEDLKNDFLLSDQDLPEELNRITDHATDQIFQHHYLQQVLKYSP